jgi:hypothetical protein
VNYLVGQTEVYRQSGAALAGEILEAWLTGTGLAEVGDPTAIYRGVTAAEVRQVAVDYLDISRRAEGVVRGTGTGAAAAPTIASTAAATVAPDAGR